MLKDILNRYSHLSLVEKLHIALRFMLCPWGKIISNFPDCASIIDVGCGHGLFINMLCLCKSDIKNAVGIDVSEKKIEIAKRSEKINISFKLGSLERTDIKADVYSIMDVLYLISFRDQEILIRNVFDLLPKGGFFAIKEVDTKPKWKFFLLIIEEFIMVKLLKITHGNSFYFRSRSGFEQLLSNIGFKVRTIDLQKGYLHPHILYVCQKQ
jgi:2-polyprenyl-3-methyl-5-hydroxy-6-metoxy-1,4-benzoquinol methylase